MSFWKSWFGGRSERAAKVDVGGHREDEHQGKAQERTAGRESPKRLYEEVMAKYDLDPLERLVVLKSALAARGRGVVAAGAELLTGESKDSGTPLQVLNEGLEFTGGVVEARPELIKAFVDLNMALRHPRRTPFPLIRAELEPVIEELARQV